MTYLDAIKQANRLDHVVIACDVRVYTEYDSADARHIPEGWFEVDTQATALQNCLHALRLIQSGRDPGSLRDLIREVEAVLGENDH